MARLAATGRQFQVAMQSTLEATHRILVETARREHAVVMRTDPRPASFRRFVDGQEGRPEEAVRPNGVITYEYQRLDLVAQFALETLFDRSPVLSGDYRRAHALFLNGVAVRNLRDWKPGDEVAVANFLPYSRKVELGVMKMRVPGTDKVYAQAERIVRRRFGNLARIDFTYRGIMGGAILPGRQGNKSDIRYPALIIKER